MSNLEARGLSFGYAGRPLLNNIDFEARPGKLTAVVGANGVGKTTLLRLLAGHLKPTHGQVLLDGTPLDAKHRRRAARHIALSPQFSAPTWPLTVEQAVLLGRAPHRGWWLPWSAADRQTVHQALAAMDLEALSEQAVTEISGGELRRLLFARILAQESTVALLDEPTAHLDLKHQEEVSHLMRALAHDRGVAVVATLHDLNQCAAFADRVALLHEGRLLASGTPEEVLSPEHVETAYGIAVDIAHHPKTGRLWISPRRYFDPSPPVEDRSKTT